MKHLRIVEWNNLLSHAPHDHRLETVLVQDGACRHHQADGVWQRVANAAAVEASYQPAAETVRAAKDAYAVAGLPARRHEARRLVHLLFDSFSHPAPAGTRSAPTRIRQLLYRAQPYQIDLQIELRLESNLLLVTGQLLDVSHPEMIGRDIQVTISNRRGSIAKTKTNQYGEFRAEVENSGDLEISFAGTGGKPIVILLPKALEP